ncbi:sensor histidine kinase [Kineosporia babensis]|uniref:histidine kinase n=1 Tax=Kineosporia babensis TaxID=499548 RepID=A0A9X1NGE4_9ACTN|nr:histidine kinase [Kineosporia babensis]MCD5312816.1 histidine kinase [Kineosporia babensis]
MRTLTGLLRRAGWPRLAYEVLLTLFCAFTTLILYLMYAPVDYSLALAGVLAVAVLGTVLVVPLRVFRPMTALALGSLISLVSGGASFVLIVLSASAGYRARQTRPVVIGFGLVLLGCVTGMSLRSDQGVVFGAFAGVMLFCGTSVFPAAVAAMIAQRRLLVMTMHQRNLELHEQQQVVAGQAQVRERNRIAAELHDSLGHRLTLMSLYTGGLAQSLSQPQAVGAGSSPTGGPASAITAEAQPSQPPQVQEALGMLREASAQAMAELRQILKILHQDGPSAGHSLNDVEEPVAAARGTGTVVELERTGEPRPLNLLAEHAGFRVVQEGLTNALRHAGGAPVRVEVRYEDDALFVEVRNRPGRPYEGTSTGQGLHGLAERVRLAGGVLSSGPVDGGGFRLGAVLPYDAEVPSSAADQPVGDFRQTIRSNSRRQRIGLITVGVALVVSVLAGIGAAVTANATEPVPEKVFASFRPGDDEARARELLPATSMLTSTGSSGEVCEMYLADLYLQPENGGEIRYEVCFRDGAVHSKRQFQDRGGE